MITDKEKRPNGDTSLCEHCKNSVNSTIRLNVVTNDFNGNIGNRPLIDKTTEDMIRNYFLVLMGINDVFVSVFIRIYTCILLYQTTRKRKPSSVILHLIPTI